MQNDDFECGKKLGFGITQQKYILLHEEQI